MAHVIISAQVINWRVSALEPTGRGDSWTCCFVKVDSTTLITPCTFPRFVQLLPLNDLIVEFLVEIMHEFAQAL